MPGLFDRNQSVFDNRYAINSLDGNLFALGSDQGYAILDLPKQTFKWLGLEKRNGRLSPDLSIAFNNQPTITDLLRMPISGKWSSFTIGALSNEPLKEWKNEHYILAMDASNNLITTKPSLVMEDGDSYVGSLEGLFLVDRRSGATLKTLRSDAIYKRRVANLSTRRRWVENQFSTFYFNSSRDTLLVQEGNNARSALVYPFGSTEVLKLDCEAPLDGPDVEIGDRYVFRKSRFVYQGTTSSCTVYDLKKGVKVASADFKSPAMYQPANFDPMIYGYKDDHIFRFEKDGPKVYEDVVEGGAFKTINVWKVDMHGEFPSDSEKWRMAVGKGPTLLICPVARTSSADRGYLVDLTSSQRVGLICPFFNISLETLLKEARIKSAQEEQVAAQKRADIANWKPKYARGQFFVNDYGIPWGVVMKVDPAKKSYLILNRTYVPKREPYYLYAEETGHYNLTENWYSEASMGSSKTTTDSYRSCESCGGAGCQFDEVRHVRGGHWEEISSTVKIYTPQHVTSSYKKKVNCTACSSQGWVKVQK